MKALVPFLLLLAVLACCAPALHAQCPASYGNGFSCIQAKGNANAGSGTTVTATLTSPTTAGHQVTVTAFACNDASCATTGTPNITLTDGTSDTISLPTTPCGLVNSSHSRVCSGIFANVGATTTFTATCATTCWYLQIIAAEWSGGATSSPYDGDNAFNGTTSAATLTVTFSSSVTALIVGYVEVDSGTAVTPGAGFSEVDETNAGFEKEAKSNTSGSNDCPWSWTGNHSAAAVCFAMKPAAVAAAPKLRTLMGVGQ